MFVPEYVNTEVMGSYRPKSFKNIHEALILGRWFAGKDDSRDPEELRQIAERIRERVTSSDNYDSRVKEIWESIGVNQ